MVDEFQHERNVWGTESESNLGGITLSFWNCPTMWRKDGSWGCGSSSLGRRRPDGSHRSARQHSSELID